MKIRKPLLSGIAWLTIIFLLIPVVVVVLASFSPNANVRIPLQPLSLNSYRAVFSDSKWAEALGVSLLLATVGSIISCGAATMAALANNRVTYTGKNLVEGGLLAPLIFPHAALALALYSIADQLNLIGSFIGVLLAHIVLTVPFAYRPINAAVSKNDKSMQEAGMSLGARPQYVFWKLTFPMLKSGIITALLFTFIISFDEATITLFLKGPDFTTLPVAIMTDIQEGTGLAVPAISAMMVAFTLLFIFLADKTVGLSTFSEKR
ncbi:hypothetical protein ASG35_12405 [Burkholderia sp. Leaf177]|uniref:ABC transporter permease n=1 Tax=Burkholderia sp. Leaf177 TaxID=1736287 RepID=UPI0006F28B25|nr:ABC transporter permease [Burkholderia sp. Leaf177]KQR77063.1 hypothetical protein ASG35_12405 [Burkholderia sp. Leaf177]